ncbi:MAG: low-specificity L-threonine aldolase [Filifactoraceae bacterium]
MKVIDLRSDTVTQPTEAMRKAAFEAVVGDDVYGDDPTVNELQAYGAKLLGKEAALFVPSGTFCNQLALYNHANRGDEVILPSECHIVQHESGAASIISGVQLRTIKGIGSEMPLDIVEEDIRKYEDIHVPYTKLICVETAFSDGSVMSLEYLKNLRRLADKYNISIHMDGARIFNAATHLEVEVREIAKYADSINVCLSKGLCAPAGSLLVGSKVFIDKAVRKRKIMGGGMRQVGILAAPALIALKDMTSRLKEDHDNAKYFADRLMEISGIQVAKDRLDINMVFFKVTDPRLFGLFTEDEMLKHNIIINPIENGEMRFVTHYYIDKEKIDYVIDVIKRY